MTKSNTFFLRLKKEDFLTILGHSIFINYCNQHSSVASVSFKQKNFKSHIKVLHKIVSVYFSAVFSNEMSF